MNRNRSYLAGWAFLQGRLSSNMASHGHRTIEFDV